MTCRSYYVQEAKQKELRKRTGESALGLVFCIILIIIGAIFLINWYSKSEMERAWIVRLHSDEYNRYILAILGWVMAGSGLVGLITGLVHRRERSQDDPAADAYLRLGTDGVCGRSSSGSSFRLPYECIQNVSVRGTAITITSSRGTFACRDLNYMAEAAEFIMQNKEEAARSTQ